MRLIQSAQAMKWADDATLQLRAQLVGKGPRPLFITPVNLRALVYRDANRGDLIGYLQAICDALEAAEVVRDDVLVQSFDGSRQLVDRADPRVEIQLTPTET